MYICTRTGFTTYEKFLPLNMPTPEIIISPSSFSNTYVRRLCLIFQRVQNQRTSWVCNEIRPLKCYRACIPSSALLKKATVRLDLQAIKDMVRLQNSNSLGDLELVQPMKNSRQVLAFQALDVDSVCHGAHLWQSRTEDKHTYNTQHNTECAREACTALEGFKK